MEMPLPDSQAPAHFLGPKLELGNEDVRSLGTRRGVGMWGERKCRVLCGDYGIEAATTSC